MVDLLYAGFTRSWKPKKGIMGRSGFYMGTLELMVLHTLSCGPMHGYAIGQWIAEKSGGVLEAEEGTLYPALHRLEDRGLVDSEWGTTDSGRQAKFYRLTRRGSRHLEDESTRWRTHSAAVAAVLASSGG
jgi:transcriptional regulator